MVVSQSLPKNTMQIRMEDNLRVHVFNINGSQYPKQHMFFCEAIWTVKHMQDQDAQIA